jgi:hypothetical protein
LAILSLLVASALAAGAALLGSPSAAKAPRQPSLRPAAGRLHAAPWLQQIERRVLRAPIHPRVLKALRSAPYATAPQGFACPVSATSACSSVPCVMYVAPGSSPRAVARRRARSCIHKASQQVPVMAR